MKYLGKEMTDYLVLRVINIILVGSIALFFSIVALGNITAFQDNWIFVQHVLSMDTTFKTPALMWRAIDNPSLQKLAYLFIIFWQLLTASICWIGGFKLIRNIKVDPKQFHCAKDIAFIGLFLGILLYLVGFIIIGGEWFAMWQSQHYNAQAAAGLFASLMMLVLIFLHQH